MTANEPKHLRVETLKVEGEFAKVEQVGSKSNKAQGWTLLQ